MNWDDASCDHHVPFVESTTPKKLNSLIPGTWRIASTFHHHGQSVLHLLDVWFHQGRLEHRPAAPGNPRTAPQVSTFP